MVDSKIALCCMAKNEDLYIEEWLKYNFKVGFDRIFVYMNDWRYLPKHKNITKIEWDGNAMQLRAYNNFIHTYGNEYDWVAFFDVDEYLVLKKHENIKAFLSEYNYPSIGINWALFGDNGLKEYDNRLVLERFTMRQIGINRHVKTILRPKGVYMTNPHCCNRGAHSPEGVFFEGPFNPQGSDEIAQLNHYFGKTLPEFVKKAERGRPDIAASSRSIEDFHCHNFNEVEDLTALKFSLC
jgi:hypothetical protein